MHRLEVFLKPHLPDARGLGLVKDIADLGINGAQAVRVGGWMCFGIADAGRQIFLCYTFYGFYLLLILNCPF